MGKKHIKVNTHSCYKIGQAVKMRQYQTIKKIEASARGNKKAMFKAIKVKQKSNRIVHKGDL